MVRWEREKDGRYYAALIFKDLFGEWTVVKSWGGKKRKGGSIAIIPCATKSDAIDMLVSIAKRRKAHGYKIVEAQSLYGSPDVRQALELDHLSTDLSTVSVDN